LGFFIFIYVCTFLLTYNNIGGGGDDDDDDNNIIELTIINFDIQVTMHRDIFL